MNRSLELTRQFIRIPSVNPMGGPDDDPIYSEKGVADLVSQLLEAGGAHPVRQGTDKHPNVVARIEQGRAQTLLLTAHTDTVSHENMTIAPFDPVVRDGRLYGRGACDTKASLAVFLDAFLAALRDPSRLKYNLIFAAVHDEEFSFGGSRLLAASLLKTGTGSEPSSRNAAKAGSREVPVPLLQQAVGGLAADWAITGEPTKLRVLHAHKGVCRFVVSTQGTSAHSALPWLGDNAIYKATAVIEAIKEYAETVQQNEHPVLGKATASLGIIAGGTTINTVPDQCILKVDRRLLPGETRDSVFAPLNALLDSRRCAADVAPPFLFAEAVWNDPKSPYCESLLAACKSAGTEPALGTADYATDACTLQAAGIPTLVFGPGDIAQAHTADESIDVEEMFQARRILDALLFQ
jgi:acetylornithine deacetylase/succinyl-diaminopimelate desuccinylase-like protein